MRAAGRRLRWRRCPEFRARGFEVRGRGGDALELRAILVSDSVVLAAVEKFAGGGLLCVLRGVVSLQHGNGLSKDLTVDR